MKYDVTYNCKNSKKSLLLCREIYKSDSEAINTVLNTARKRNKLRAGKDTEIISVNIYRLVNKAGYGYFKTIVNELKV